jgi:hypothetical protein
LRDASFSSSPEPLQVYHGDILSYTITNRTDTFPTYVHMLSLNASWNVSTLLWNVRIPPRGQRTGDLSMTLPRRINDSDDDPLLEEVVEDRIVVIFCVGEQCAERMVTAAEWLGSVYVPPVFVEHPGSGEERVRVKVRGVFVPPPNWVVKVFKVQVRTVPRPLHVVAAEAEASSGRGEGTHMA